MLLRSAWLQGNSTVHWGSKAQQLSYPPLGLNDVQTTTASYRIASQLVEWHTDLMGKERVWEKAQQKQKKGRKKRKKEDEVPNEIPQQEQKQGHYGAKNMVELEDLVQSGKQSHSLNVHITSTIITTTTVSNNGNMFVTSVAHEEEAPWPLRSEKKQKYQHQCLSDDGTDGDESLEESLEELPPAPSSSHRRLVSVAFMDTSSSVPSLPMIGNHKALETYRDDGVGDLGLGGDTMHGLENEYGSDYMLDTMCFGSELHQHE